MKIVFFGTPDYSVNIVDKLHDTFKKKGKSPIVAVVTQSPKKVGRKKQLEYSPVDSWAHKKNIPIFYKSSDLIKEKIDADIGVLASYGEILPDTVLEFFEKGIINIHPSLLPKYRGASPVQSVLVSGDKETGISIIKLDKKMDHGPILVQVPENVLQNDTTTTLRDRLFEKSIQLLIENIEPFFKGKLKLKEQDHEKATYTNLLKKDHGFIPPQFLDAGLKGLAVKTKWDIPFIKNYSLNPTPLSLYNFIQAMQPWPGAWTLLRSKATKEQVPKRLKIIKAHLEGEKLVLDTVQLEGKNPVSWEQFKQGYPQFELSS